jgi:hypothetical protein
MLVIRRCTAETLIVFGRADPGTRRPTCARYDGFRFNLAVRFLETVAGIRDNPRSRPEIVRRLASWPERRYLRRSGYDAVVVDVARYPYMGFGATMSWVHMAYVAADAVDAPLLFVHPDGWPFGGRRPECALDRFVKIPVVDPAALDGTPHALLNPGDWRNLRRWGFFDELHWPYCAFGHSEGFEDIEEYRRSLLARHYAPTPFAEEEVSRRLRFLPSRYVAWHVRRGDKVQGPNAEDDPVSLHRFAEATAELLEDDPSPPRQLVICTDSPAVLEEAAALEQVQCLGLEVVFDPAEKRWDGYCDIHRTGGIDSTEEMLEEILNAQKIVEILRRAEVLVGCNSSYLFRVPAMLNPSERVASLSENNIWRRYFPI